MAHMREDPSLSLGLAMAHTWYGYLLHLAFIPLVGPLVQRLVEEKKKKNPFVENEE